MPAVSPIKSCNWPEGKPHRGVDRSRLSSRALRPALSGSGGRTGWVRPRAARKHKPGLAPRPPYALGDGGRERRRGRVMAAQGDEQQATGRDQPGEAATGARAVGPVIPGFGEGRRVADHDVVGFSAAGFSVPPQFGQHVERIAAPGFHPVRQPVRLGGRPGRGPARGRPPGSPAGRKPARPPVAVRPLVREPARNLAGQWINREADAAILGTGGHEQPLHLLGQPLMGTHLPVFRLHPAFGAERPGVAAFSRRSRPLVQPRRVSRVTGTTRQWHYAAMASPRGSTARRAPTSASIMASVCSGVGVSRSRSCPTGTVGKLIGVA